MDDIKSLFDKKEYKVVADLLKSSKEPSEVLMRITCLTILNEDKEAIKVINTFQKELEKVYPQKLMTIHFELLLKNKMFKEANEAVAHYNELPYISQQVEEMLRDMPQRIIDEQVGHNVQEIDIDDASNILKNEKDNAKLAQVLFNLNAYKFEWISEDVVDFLTRKDVNPNFRVYALIYLVDHAFKHDVNYLGRDGLMVVNPSKIKPPFTSKTFYEATEMISKKAMQNVTIRDTALHLINCLVLDLYPNDIDLASPDMLSDAIILIAKDYIKESYNESNEKLIELKNKIRKIIESTPALIM